MKSIIVPALVAIVISSFVSWSMSSAFCTADQVQAAMIGSTQARL